MKHFRYVHIRFSIFFIGVFCSHFIGCKKDSPIASSGNPSVQAKITNVQTVQGTSGTAHFGSLPSSGGGPDVTLPANLNILNGGSSIVSISSPNLMSRIIVSVEGTDGYWEIILPSDTTLVMLLVTFAQNLTGNTIPLTFLAGNSVNQFGLAVTIAANIIQVGTGDIQVSLSWDALSDVDLHVIDPDGEEIYWGNRISSSGGILDLDSNPACSIDSVNNENITWPTGSAPLGTYIVLVNYWSSCDQLLTNYSVTVTLAGMAPQVFTGTFTGPGNFGGAGSGIEITRFTK
jgi:hypothetical protein